MPEQLQVKYFKMKKYIVLFEDSDGHADQRQKYMADHLEFLSRNAKYIHAAGPLFDPRNNHSAGGLWIVDGENLEDIEILIEADPFWPTGLRKSVQILEWTQVFADGEKLTNNEH